MLTDNNDYEIFTDQKIVDIVLREIDNNTAQDGDEGKPDEVASREYPILPFI